MTEGLCLDVGRQNYHSVVLAGLGSVGRGILAVGQSDLNDFDEVYLIDKDSRHCKIAPRYNYPVRQMDIEDGDFLVDFLKSLKEPVLFVNACTDINTVQLRRVISTLPVGYIDICESRTPANPQGRFTLSMHYTNQSQHSDFPHLICQGSNPGMVEYITRMLIDELGNEKNGYAVTIYENDQMTALDSSENALVSWSPEDLVEEVMVAPVIEYAGGRFLEGPAFKSEEILTRWQDDLHPAFKVGHEDIWNLACLEQISDARFFYGFNSEVMDVLRTHPQHALKTLRLPAEGEKIEGLQRIVVSVEHPSGKQKSLLWEADHATTQQRCGINAVQYQTAGAVLMSVLLMQHTEAGRRAGTFNASTLPLTGSDWDVLRRLMNRVGIDWRPVPKGYVCYNCENPSHSALGRTRLF